MGKRERKISSWFSKANGTDGTGGGNAGGEGGGTDSRIDELKEKDPADWTLDDQKAVAEDIGKKGNSSELYAKAKDAMDTGTTWSITLTDGKTLRYKIIGINHDDLADGSGKAGLTFLTTSMSIRSRMNATATNAGGADAVGAPREDEQRRDLESHATRFPVLGEGRQEAHEQRRWRR